MAVLESRAERDDEIGKEHKEIFTRLGKIETSLAVIQSKGSNGSRIKGYAGQGAFFTAIVLALEGIFQFAR